MAQHHAKWGNIANFASTALRRHRGLQAYQHELKQPLTVLVRAFEPLFSLPLPASLVFASSKSSFIVISLHGQCHPTMEEPGRCCLPSAAQSVPLQPLWCCYVPMPPVSGQVKFDGTFSGSL